MEHFTLRPAEQADDPAIRRLIRQVHINPMGLDWRRFVIATDSYGNLIGCGQVKPHGASIHELASIAVTQEWRGQGVASAIIERLIKIHPGPLYLTCRARLGTFYPRFGFRVLSAEEMPAHYRRIHRMFAWLQRLGFTGEGLLVMKKEPQDASS